MRPLTISSLLLASSGFADAHTLVSDAGIPAQLGHQLLGMHHLPLTAVLIVGSIYILHRCYRTGRHDKGGTP